MTSDEQASKPGAPGRSGEARTPPASPMRLRHIEVFNAIYLSGSISAAAQLLNVSQPSLSKTLQHAEDFGLTFDPLDPSQAEVRYEFWAEARERAPVFHSPKYDVWFIMRYEDVEVAMRDHKHFSTRSVFDPARPWPDEVKAILAEGYSQHYLLSNNDPPEHTPLKRAVTKAFSRSQTRWRWLEMCSIS